MSTPVRRRREEGCCKVFTRQGHYYTIPLEEHGAVLSAWKQGAAFYDGHDFHGDRFTIKLGEVVALRADTPAGILADIEETRLDAEEDRAESWRTGDPD